MEKYHAHRKLVYEALKSFAPESVLEAGCDKGGNIEWIIEKFPKIKKLGCDISTDDVEYSQKTFPEFEIRLGDIRSLPYPEKSVDVVIVDMVMYLAGYDENIINQLVKTAKKGVIISEKSGLNGNYETLKKLIPAEHKVVFHSWDTLEESAGYYVISFGVGSPVKTSPEPQKGALEPLSNQKKVVTPKRAKKRSRPKKK